MEIISEGRSKPSTKMCPSARSQMNGQVSRLTQLGQPIGWSAHTRPDGERKVPEFEVTLHTHSSDRCARFVFH